MECGLYQAGDGSIRLRLTGWDGRGMLRVDPGLIYSTYLGGTGTGDQPRNIAVDSLGQAVIVGRAKSGFPTTPGAFQVAYSGGIADAFITKLSDDGASLVFSTYIGTSTSSEGAGGLALLDSGEIIVSGNTESAAFPVTPGAFDTTINGAGDAFLTRLSADGSSLDFSTLLGGMGSDSTPAVRLDPTGDIVLAGRTDSPDFPTTAGAYATTLLADADAYVTRLSADGGRLVFSTFGGTAGAPAQTTAATDVVLGLDGSVYVAGFASGTGLPVTAGVLDRTHNGEVDGFVMKLDPTGSSQQFCTYFGGTGWEDVRGIRVDALGAAYIMGLTDSPDLPVTPNAYSTSPLGSDCPYVAKLSPDGTAVDYCT
jgi:hypothetical protein